MEFLYNQLDNLENLMSSTRQDILKKEISKEGIYENFEPFNYSFNDQEIPQCFKRNYDFDKDNIKIEQEKINND